MLSEEDTVTCVSPFVKEKVGQKQGTPSEASAPDTGQTGGRSLRCHKKKRKETIMMYNTVVQYIDCNGKYC